MTMLTYERKLVNLNIRQELTFLYYIHCCLYVYHVGSHRTTFYCHNDLDVQKKENLINDTNVLDNVD